MNTHWKQLRTLYTKDHLSKGLKNPKIRLNALANLESIIQRKMPEIIDNPSLLLEIDKASFKSMVQRFKGSDLNSAESSVINGLYKFILQIDKNEIVEKVGAISKSDRDINSGEPKINLYKKMAGLFEELLGEPIEFGCSQTIPDLNSTPLPDQFPKTWNYLADAYKLINGAGLDLNSVIEKKTGSLKLGRQESDVLITSPFILMIEYDEEQHFNQYRYLTLQSPMYDNWNGFDPELYNQLSNRTVKPGSKKSGFHFLKSKDPLFPEDHNNEKQDNRLRQRAFRDMVKDAWSIENDWKPTLRVPAYLVEWKRNSLTDSDWMILRDYIERVFFNRKNVF